MDEVRGAVYAATAAGGYESPVRGRAWLCVLSNVSSTVGREFCASPNMTNFSDFTTFSARFQETSAECSNPKNSTGFFDMMIFSKI